MLLVNDNIFDPNDESSPFHREYHDAVQELKLLYRKNMDDNGRQVLVLTSANKIIINKTGYPEPLPNVFIPYTAKSKSKDGYTYLWRYTESNPVYDSSGRQRYEDNGFLFKGKLVLELSEMDKAFFLLYKSPLCSIEQKSTSHAFVLNDRAQSVKESKDKKARVALEYYIYDDNSPLVTDPDKLFDLCLAYDVEKAQHLKSMHSYFIGSLDKSSAGEFLASAQQKLEKAVINKLNYGVPISKFIDAVVHDSDWVQMKIKIMSALKNGFIKYDSVKGEVHFDIGGFQTHICNIQASKRGSDMYIDEIIDSITSSEDNLEIINSLSGTTDAGFDPKLFDPKNEDVNNLQFHELKALAKWLDIKTQRNTKSDVLRKLITEEYKKRGF